MQNANWKVKRQGCDKKCSTHTVCMHYGFREVKILLRKKAMNECLFILSNYFSKISR